MLFVMDNQAVGKKLENNWIKEDLMKNIKFKNCVTLEEITKGFLLYRQLCSWGKKPEGNFEFLGETFELQINRTEIIIKRINL